ncbi:ChaN family lipoprotein [uncultured Lamprocystis sp.]|uniref:ChaN family lipoprotein n=1 Tax=uncultured Lamprocystis sp. TaxID=543132 RepID=UPI0025E114AF|nr:ChaN family lipoprotein [uncultured Lamprocystis sp.]
MLTAAPLTKGTTFCALALAQSAATGPVAQPPVSTGMPDTASRVLDLSSLTDMDALLDRLTDRRVIFVGENHERYEDHLNQLAVIQGLHARGRTLAIGMEFFQQPFQADIDAYIAGAIDEAEFLRRTQYFDRWRYDYRLYRPILQFAREHRIPVIALNLDSALTKRVGEVGIDGLDPQERARVPAEIDRSDTAYQARVKAVFDQHPMPDKKSFERFIEVQLLWDEGMAERAARYLQEHPQQTLVVLAGAGHLEYGQGIPKRLLRRQPVSAVSLLNANQRELDPAAADYLLFPRPVDLPQSGMLGVMLNPEVGDQGVEIQGFSEDSGAKAAGVKEGDRIVRVGEQPVSTYADIRIALIDALPGRRVPVEVLRKPLIGADEMLIFDVELR